ncbi:MAG: flagellar protein [Sphingomonadales bacterium]|nr:flagellar protein [Sphingomonadales bacterium]
MASILRQAVVSVALIATQARAEGWQNLDALDAAVTAAVGSTGAARPVDRRIKLAICPETVSVSAPLARSVTVACNSIGWRIRVPVSPTALAFAGPMLMRKGDPVSVVTGAAGFSASVSGIAEGEGRLGERVRVRTGPGASVIVGLIADPGTVRIY